MTARGIGCNNGRFASSLAGDERTPEDFVTYVAKNFVEFVGQIWNALGTKTKEPQLSIMRVMEPKSDCSGLRTRDTGAPTTRLPTQDRTPPFSRGQTPLA